MACYRWLHWHWQAEADPLLHSGPTEPFATQLCSWLEASTVWAYAQQHSRLKVAAKNASLPRMQQPEPPVSG